MDLPQDAKYNVAMKPDDLLIILTVALLIFGRALLRAAARLRHAIDDFNHRLK
jgi:Sec-independent protein translocase protein TatA